MSELAFQDQGAVRHCFGCGGEVRATGEVLGIRVEWE